MVTSHFWVKVHVFFNFYQQVCFLSIVNSICKSASTTRLISKTFSLQYLGQKSSKLFQDLAFKSLFLRFFFAISRFGNNFDQWLIFHHKQLCIWPQAISERYEPANHCTRYARPAKRHRENKVRIISVTLLAIVSKKCCCCKYVIEILFLFRVSIIMFARCSVLFFSRNVSEWHVGEMSAFSPLCSLTVAFASIFLF